MKNLLLLLPLWLFFSCAQPVTQSELDPTEDIINQWSEFVKSWEAENAEGCISIYHDDIQFIPPGFEPSSTSKDVASFYSMLFNDNQSSKYTHTTQFLSYNNDIAVEYAHFTVDWINNDGEPWTFKARMVNHWTPDDEGKWKIKTLIFNTPAEETEQSNNE